LIGEPEGKIPLGIHWRRWEDNIKIHLNNIEQEEVGWIHLAEHRDQWWALVNTGIVHK
jgi:hypothetical protein